MIGIDRSKNTLVMRFRTKPQRFFLSCLFCSWHSPTLAKYRNKLKGEISSKRACSFFTCLQFLPSLSMLSLTCSLKTVREPFSRASRRKSACSSCEHSPRLLQSQKPTYVQVQRRVGGGVFVVLRVITLRLRAIRRRRPVS